MIFSYLVTEGNWRTLLSAATVCASWTEETLDLIWAQEIKDIFLLRLLGPMSEVVFNGKTMLVCPADDRFVLDFSIISLVVAQSFHPKL